MYFQILLLTCFAVGSQCEEHAINEYDLIEVLPQNEHQRNILKELRRNLTEYFWIRTVKQNSPQQLLIHPQHIPMFKSILAAHGIEYKKVFEHSAFSLKGTSAADRISFEKYHNYNTIVEYLKLIARIYPATVSLINLGQTYEDRDQFGVKISSGNCNNIQKPEILVDGGIHGREWMAPAMVLYIIRELAENPANAKMIEKVDWYIIPILNPDGYEYSHTTDRLWRKNRSPGIKTKCSGVDGNRNFGFHWNKTGKTDNECIESYPGPHANSEYETVNFMDFAITHKARLKLYLSFHSYGQYLLYPWGYTSANPSNHEELQQLGDKVAEAIKKVYGTVYEVGTTARLMHKASGSSSDWMMGAIDVPLVYTIELPGRGNKFNPPAKEIKGIVVETFEGIKVYHQYVEELWTSSQIC